MATLVQIILTNLLLSCDNVVIIASSTKDLHPKQSSKLRFLGICLAPFLVLLFIWLTSFLLNLTWMHIRILGGLLLICVNHNMLSQIDKEGPKKTNSEGLGMAILSIIAANLTLSLESSLSLLSIVTKNGTMLGGKEIGLIVIGLLICLPILLLFGKTVAKLLDKYSIITYLCAGYLVFMAMNMIFEDESIHLFCHAINFSLTTPIAAVVSILVVASSLFTSSKIPSDSLKRRKRIAVLAFSTIAYSLFTVISITYLSTNPMIDGSIFYADQMLGFTPCGANAIYTLAIPPHLFPIFIIFLSGILYGDSITEQPTAMRYMQRFKQSVICIISLAFFYILICMAGLTNTLGFGSFDPRSLIILPLHIFALVIYLAIFFLIRSLSKNNGTGTFGCFIFIFLENLLVDIFMYVKTLGFFVSLLPDYYVHTLTPNVSLFTIMQLLLSGSAVLIATLWAGGYFFTKRRHKRIL